MKFLDSSIDLDPNGKKLRVHESPYEWVHASMLIVLYLW